jgi:hypothetical protein
MQKTVRSTNSCKAKINLPKGKSISHKVKWKYSSTHSYPWCLMAATCELHVPTALSQVNEPHLRRPLHKMVGGPKGLEIRNIPEPARNQTPVPQLPSSYPGRPSDRDTHLGRPATFQMRFCDPTSDAGRHVHLRQIQTVTFHTRCVLYWRPIVPLALKHSV